MLINASKGSASTLKKVKWVDTHAHLNFPVFHKDKEKVIKTCLENNIWVINIGSNFVSSQRAVEIAQTSPYGVFAAIGLHPMNLETGLVKIKFDEQEEQSLEKEFDFKKYKELGSSDRVVAIGEIGFDYYWRPKTTKKKELFKEKQRDLLFSQLRLAQDLDLPVIFHCRMAHNNLIKVLKSQIPNPKLKGVIHCFTGTWEQAQQYMAMGFYLGFNGLIFKLNLDEIIKKTPLERVLIETDCPYLTPPQFQDQRNTPLNLRYIAERIAEIKNISIDKVAELTTNNAKMLFGI